jgi:hypothetical protein
MADRRVPSCNRVNDMARQGASRYHYCGARHRCLGNSGAAKHLRGTLAAAARKERHTLFDPYGELAEAPGVPERRSGHWKERHCGCALELAPTHFAA